jgi:hypothetical protein
MLKIVPSAQKRAAAPNDPADTAVATAGGVDVDALPVSLWLVRLGLARMKA